MAVLDLTCSLRQREPSGNLDHEANICYAYESNLLSPQGEMTGLNRTKFELRLIHTFISLIAPVQASLSSAGIAREKTNIPLLAMKYVYARDIILGCSALYLRESNPNDVSLVEASHAYAVRAIGECSRQIQTGVDEGNAEAYSLLLCLLQSMLSEVESMTVSPKIIHYTNKIYCPSYNGFDNFAGSKQCWTQVGCGYPTTSTFHQWWML